MDAVCEQRTRADMCAGLRDKATDMKARLVLHSLKKTQLRPSQLALQHSTAQHIAARQVRLCCMLTTDRWSHLVLSHTLITWKGPNATPSVTPHRAPDR